MNEYVVGIDIGSSKVRAAAGKLDKYGKLQITGVTSVPCNGLKKGIVVDIDNTAEGIKKSIEQLERMIDCNISEAYISIPAEICELTENRGIVAVSSDDREIRKNDVQRVVKAAKIITISSDKEIIGVIPEQFIVDGYDNIIDPLGMSGLRLEVDAQIVLCRSTIISNLLKSIKKAGIILKGMVFQPMANSLAVLNKEEAEIGTLIVDIGSETTNITVLKNNRLEYVDMMPIGGNTITNDISVCLKLPLSEAEKLKIKYGKIDMGNEEENLKVKINANYNDIIEVDCNILNEIITARVEEMVCLIKKRISINDQMNNISGIVIVGGGIALLRDIDELFRKILQKPTRVGLIEYIGEDSPMYTSAVGVVKDVVDSLKYSSDVDKSSLESLNKREINYMDKDENEEYEEEESGVFSKIKSFFTDFF